MHMSLIPSLARNSEGPPTPRSPEPVPVGLSTATPATERENGRETTVAVIPREFPAGSEASIAHGSAKPAGGQAK